MKINSDIRYQLESNIEINERSEVIFVLSNGKIFQGWRDINVSPSTYRKKFRQWLYGYYNSPRKRGDTDFSEIEINPEDINEYRELFFGYPAIVFVFNSKGQITKEIL